MRDNSLGTLHEKVKMPDHQFLVNFFSYERELKGPIFPMHWHEQIEMIFLTQGVMRIQCNHRSFEPGAGDLLFINSNELHSGYLIQGPLSLYCMIVDISMLQSRFIDACEDKYIHPISENFILFQNLIKQDTEVGLYFRNISREYQERNPGYELAIKASIINLLVRLFRNYVIRIFSNREFDARNNNMQLVNAVLKHIYDNFSEDTDLESLAHQFGVSKYHLCHQFKKLTGKTLTDQLNSYRIRQAINLLQHSELKVSEIATRVGFNDVCYFNRIFKRYSGISPTRSRHQSPSS